MRRVVVTGMGAVTPLGLNLATSWANLIASRCGVVQLSDPAFATIPSKVAALVPSPPASWVLSCYLAYLFKQLKLYRNKVDIDLCSPNTLFKLPKKHWKMRTGLPILPKKPIARAYASDLALVVSTTL
jgi:hypothetical protein